MTNDEFILIHRNENTAQLALKKAPNGVDLKFCLEQIHCWQKAERKLPHWAMTPGIIFPPALSMEQCSSEATAHYKQNIVKNLSEPITSMTDLTGGFGVDFSFLAPLFSKATYVERQEHLCQIVMHNLPLLGINHAQVICAECSDFLRDSQPTDLIFIDPARRDKGGRRTIRLQDCTPNVVTMLPLLSQRTRYLVLKLSPMLDIHTAMLDLKKVIQVHIVSVEGECRELLLVMDMQYTSSPTIHCADLGRNPSLFIVSSEHKEKAIIAEKIETYIYEPNSSILKAGVQDALCGRFGIKKIHANSNLFTSPLLIEDFPGRKFRLVGLHDFSKQNLKTLFTNIKKANLTVRNFPATVEELRKRFKLKEGGSVYLFATTLSGEKHALLQCEKV